MVVGYDGCGLSDVVSSWISVCSFDVCSRMLFKLLITVSPKNSVVSVVIIRLLLDSKYSQQEQRK